MIVYQVNIMYGSMPLAGYLNAIEDVEPECLLG